MSSADRDPATWWIRLSNTADQAVVQLYTFLGTPVDETDPNSVLHWTILVKYVSPDGDSQVIHLNMSPGGQEDGTGILMVSEVTDEVSEASVLLVSEPAVGTTIVTVGHFLDSLASHGRNRYKFDSTGSGCRFWCRTVLSDLEKQGLVPAGAVNRLDAYVEEKNQKNPMRFPMPIRKGTFY